jgi:hypothetical protein
VELQPVEKVDEKVNISTMTAAEVEGVTAV